MKKNEKNMIKSIVSVLKNQDADLCPSPERLLLYIQSDLPEKEMKELKLHLDMCPMCTEAVLKVSAAREDVTEAPVDLWEKAEPSMDNRFAEYIDSMQPKKFRSISDVSMWGKMTQSFFSAFKFPQISYAGGVIVLAFCFLYGYAYLSRPEYFTVANFEPEKRVLRTAQSTSQLDLGIGAYYSGRYGEAGRLLEAYLNDHPDNYTANYYLGLVRLSQAKVRLLGLPYRFDHARINAGISFLETALQIGAGNNLYRENCYWYLGKAYLMLGDFDSAREQFQNITRIDQPNLVRKQDARNMLLQIEGMK